MKLVVRGLNKYIYIHLYTYICRNTELDGPKVLVVKLKKNRLDVHGF